MMRSVALVVGLALILAGSAPADEPPTATTPVYPMPEVLVEAPRPSTKAGGAAAVETHVDSLKIPVDPTAEEVLREIPLLHVRKNSRGEAEISARGSESRQVAVLVDGVPLTLAWDARADVSVIPATAIQDVVFTRGLSSMLYGPNVLGGIVELGIGRGASVPEERSLQVMMGADHLGSVGTAATVAVPFARDSGAWLVRGGLGFRDTPGQPLARGVRERVPAGDDLRLNTDAEALNGFVALRHLRESGAWLSFSASSYREERGIAAQLDVDDEDARFWRYPHVSRTLAVLSAGSGFRESPLGGRGDIEASLGLDRGRTEIDAYTSSLYDEIDTFENGDDQTLTLRLLADQSLGARGDLRGAFTLATIDHDEEIPAGAFEYRQRLWSAGIENVWRLAEAPRGLNALTLSVGGAYDAASTPKAGGRETLDPLDEWGGRIGLSAAVLDRRAVLHAGVSRRARFPALRELYSGALNRFAPNPDLEPEKLLTTEAGVTARLGRGELQAVAFHNRLHDAVVRITLEDRRFMRVNRDELTSTGLELLGAYAIGPVDLSTSVTVQSVDLTDPGAEETRKPENLPELAGELSARFPLVGGAAAGAALDYTGSQFSIDPSTGEDVELDAAAVVNAHVARIWPLRLTWGGGRFSRLEARVAVDNVGDVASYDGWGLPEQGRRFRFELRMQ